MNRLIGVLLVLCTLPAAAGDKKKQSSLTTLDRYIASLPVSSTPDPGPIGSLWSDSASFANLSSDATARHLHDLVTIRIVEDTSAESSADVTAQRKFDAQSGISALAGKVDTSGIRSLFSPQSSQNLTGKGQANSQTRLRTSVTGRVAAVMPNGVMVVEAERSVHLNNETQTIVLRGTLRPADVMADNSVLSTSLANLEIELKGKGVVSDATRPPNRLVRSILWLLGF